MCVCAVATPERGNTSDVISGTLLHPHYTNLCGHKYAPNEPKTMSRHVQVVYTYRYMYVNILYTEHHIMFHCCIEALL